MRKFSCLIFFIAFFSFISSEASHIVGGEFQLVPKGRGNTYSLSLRMYFDSLNAHANLLYEDLRITVSIFQKSNNQLVDRAILDRKSPVKVPYTFEACQAELEKRVKTLLLHYEGDITLAPERYNHPQGYYVVWERCCRNEVITNIVDPGGAGQVFFLEFPPVIKDGVKMINASPVFGDIVGDYFCLNEPNTFNFGATDPNGDSLVYSLVTPYKGNSSIFNPRPDPGPAPYAPVVWKSGYNVNNMIPGTPALSVNPQTGLLSVTPSQEGLFVISMLCEEYRDGVRIGAVRRDFQFLVVGCPVNYAPEIRLSNQDTQFQGDTFVVMLNENKCFSLTVTDPNYNEHGKPENIKIIGVTTNVPPSIFSSPQSGQLRPGNDTIRSNFCFSPCDKLLIETDTIFDMHIVAQDEFCPHPKSDTLDIIVWIKVQENSKPRIGYVPKNDGVVTVVAGKEILIDVYAADDDPNDLLTLSAYGLDFNLEDYGMQFAGASGSDSISTPFRWNPTCENLEKGIYEVIFKVVDNSCIYTHVDYDTLVIRVENGETDIHMIRPPNLVTPNSDGKNDVYELRDLPPDNCDYFFKKIEIYNRWGAKVFEDSRRDFKWQARKFPDGLYFYTIDLNKKTVSGWIHVLSGD